MRCLFTFLFLSLFPISAQAQITPLSTWVNTRGSTLTAWFVEPVTGSFIGTYVNNAAGFECQGAPYEVRGLTKGTAVTFKVDWNGLGVPDCKSTTIWQGRVVGPTMSTRWTLDYTGRDGKPHRMYGRDRFTRR
ncbi:hypothetical protein FNL55_14570 [Tardiphaga sp. vice352]|uniref:avidin/streptavidin family protein n=1 Tax=unclassified Tardiphaga TaxID=2631404 RepID=UPI001163A908|nr:hypothetical protein FNL53_14855 [Tardiphaga sp. vice278]QDM22062.1 hypothetical protein FIU28_13515 [Tardiphaga sp. vice154]QDM27315.1 hypothetical protein FNL56_15170 [Tardiphaga sp. vice304]QDM32440.1 hypothetical protein FNL55_14570 [Tardiphaga sp. vice352]